MPLEFCWRSFAMRSRCVIKLFIAGSGHIMKTLLYLLSIIPDGSWLVAELSSKSVDCYKTYSKDVSRLQIDAVVFLVDLPVYVLQNSRLTSVTALQEP
jgi:hypothetical protein